MFERLQESLTQLPLLARFAFAMTVFLTVPALCKRIHLPAVVGLLAAGVIFGPHGLQVGPKHNEVAEYFAEVGKLLLMFFAGLEIDVQQFQRTRNRSLIFGLATFSLPLAAGFAVGMGFGYGWIGALLIGSLLASHTLLGYPIVQRLGLVRNEAVTVTIGATIFTDIASLMVLAICIPIHMSGFSPVAFILQLVQLAVYVPLVLFGLRARRPPPDGTNERLQGGPIPRHALGGGGGWHWGRDDQSGRHHRRFLAGLALNRAVHHSPAKAELEFLGNTLFIPVFFVTVGFLINPRVFVESTITNLGLVSSIVLGLIFAKLLAALIATRAFHYAKYEGLIMWSLSLPQVAATLAAALVAYERPEFSR